MRFVALALILISLPIFIGMLRQNPDRRGLALTALGMMLFCGYAVRIDASIISWPLWNGIAKGAEVSAVDTLSLALIATRAKRGGMFPFWGLLGFYGATLVLSIFASTVPVATMFVWWQWVRLVVIFTAVAGECHRPEARTGLIRGLSLGLMLQAGFVIYQKLQGVVQATGTMPHQNMLGMMTELALLPLIAALLGGERGWLPRLGALAGLIVVVGGGSRGTMALVGGGILVLTLVSLWRQVTPTKLKIVGLGALVLALTVPLGVLTLKERFGSGSVITEETERAAFERAAKAMAWDHPIGVGANMYVPTANTDGYAQRAGVAWNFANRSAVVHNAYLVARAETGWAGQLAYMLLLFVPLIVGLRFVIRYRRDPAGDIVLGSTVALGVLAIHNTYEFAGLTYPVFVVMVVNLAIIGGLTRIRRNVRRSTGSLIGHPQAI